MAREPILDNPLEQYLREVNAYPLLTREAEYALAKRYQDEGDQDDARALVTANLRFVVKVAYQFSNYDIKLTDLIQEGNIGLMKAVQKFKPDRGFRLISYAVWWIKAYIQNYIINTWSLVRVGPVAQQRKVLFGRRELPAPEGQRAGDAATAAVAEGADDGEATYLIVAESTEGVTASGRRKPRRPTAKEVDEWRRAALAARRDLDLDGTISEDGRLTLGETIAADLPDAEEQFASAEITAMVAERLAELHSELNEKEMVISPTTHAPCKRLAMISESRASVCGRLSRI
jgi:RNA polymerase sigma-32 factor